MFTKISNSWRLVKASWAVLRADKELIVFPLVSTAALIIVLISFALPMLASGLLQAVADGSGSSIASSGAEIIGLIVAFLFYLVNYTIITFSNTALVGAALIRLRGGDPTVRDGFQIAQSRITSILGYAAIAATVGMILRAIQNNDNIIARILAGIVGFAWSIATYMVVPVLVVENLGPVEAIKRSASLLRRTWGEQLAGEFGIGMISGLLMFAAILLGIPIIIAAASSGSVVMIVLAIALFVLTLSIIGLLNSILSGIYQAALYLYTTEGTVSSYFEADMIEGAFKPKRQ